MSRPRSAAPGRGPDPFAREGGDAEPLRQARTARSSSPTTIARVSTPVFIEQRSGRSSAMASQAASGVWPAPWHSTAESGARRVGGQACRSAGPVASALAQPGRSPGPGRRPPAPAARSPRPGGGRRRSAEPSAPSVRVTTYGPSRRLSTSASRAHSSKTDRTFTNRSRSDRRVVAAHGDRVGHLARVGGPRQHQQRVALGGVHERPGGPPAGPA